jgi:hypothetical protein
MPQLALVRNIEEFHERVVIIVNLAIEKRLDRQFELVGRGGSSCGQDREGEKPRYLVFPVVTKERHPETKMKRDSTLGYV